MDTTTADPLVGRLLDGRYRIESRIARGGMATVYLALDIRLDRTVALKVMHRSLAEDPAFVRRFIGEAKSVASLSHPNVVHVFDQGTDNDVVYLSMEYVPGKTLRDILRDRGRLPAREALEIMIPVLAALGAAHQAGMVHRDVKPENVLMTDDGRVKVVDFGLARAIEATNQTRTGVMIGTIGYMAPEQVMTGAADVRSDVYSAGIMLFELVTGQQPYDGETPMSVAYRHVHDTVPAPSSVIPDVPPLVDTLVAHATAREPHDRPADATAMLVAAVDAHRMLPRMTNPPMSHSQPHGHYSQPHGRPQPQGPSQPHTRPPAASPHAAPAHTLIQPRVEVPERRGFRPNWFLVILAAVMVVAVGLTGWYFSQSEKVTVPDLVGTDMALAENKATRLGFTIKKAAGKHDEKVAEGLVLSTDPVAKSEVDDGTTITLVPSLGPKRVVVPDVTGMTGNDARAKIAAAGLTVGSVKRLANTEVERDKVIRTSPQVAEKVKEGAKVDIFVSAGMVMPDVNGMGKDEAAAYLGGQGFQVQVQEVDDDAEPCTVIAQAPKAKSEVDRGAQVMVTVARCQTDFWDWFGRGDNEARDDQQFTVVPGVTGKDVKDARAELEAAGFKVRVQRLGNRGVVQYQRPLPNSERPPGITVYLWH
ncbi:Stk1 family PASTA domain-containing Ser/Thr kinase [Nonomuraea basaltis]|uniref:Stk1 family PASTA domain-containing Ser/Thr kinase n=1 Tax=Nonomuraea basaltis TaxID=2495887 RepID=UPI00110C6B3A|nr:Stk1 family PASTA domain-containing Ser/Thr kinase [Nonomuraea basaltis]TMR97001.1 Stk1 family PASTA domain-containing Ser/Thr kinase [Nonomuraea basaltis]